MIQANCSDDQDKVQSGTDTGKEFTYCQTPRKPIGISPVSLHTFMETLKCDISEVYKVKDDCLKYT